MPRMLTACFVLVTSAAATVAEAQVIDRPPRSTDRTASTTSGLLGGRRSTTPQGAMQQFTFAFDTLIGYDDNISAGQGAALPAPGTPRHRGTVGTVSGVLRYERNSPQRGLDATVRSVVATYGGIDVRPVVSGRASVHGFARFAKRFNASVFGEADYQPTFVLGTPAILGPEPVPEFDPTAGVTEFSSSTAGGGFDLTAEWSARHHTSVAVRQNRFTTSGSTDTDGDLEMTERGVVASHVWAFRRNTQFRVGYSLSRQLGGGAADEDELETQTGTMGLEVRVPISRSRRLSLSANGGMTRAKTLSVSEANPIDYSTPAADVSLRLDVGRSWALSADGRRSVSRLEGLTEQSFVTTEASVWTGGLVGTRSAVSFATSYAEGDGYGGDEGRYSTVNAVAQLEQRFSRCCSALVSVGRYWHRLRSVTVVPAGFPNAFTRNTVRVGITVWLPLYGTFSRGER